MCPIGVVLTAVTLNHLVCKCNIYSSLLATYRILYRWGSGGAYGVFIPWEMKWTRQRLMLFLFEYLGIRLEGPCENEAIYLIIELL
jgi:hypothetical protein